MFEDCKGECTLTSKILTDRFSGYTSCFIGGAVTCKEEEEIYKQLAESGEIKKLINVIEEKIEDDF